MNINLSQLTLTAASFAVVLSAISPTPAQAATVTYDFTINNLDGDLAGNSFSGSFTYDDALLTGSGSEYLGVSSLLFNLLGTDYTEADDPFAEVAFFEGTFLGLIFAVGNPGVDAISFAFVPGFFDASDAYFTYDFTGSTGKFGTGDIQYQVVPTPVLLPGLIGLGLGALRKKAEREESNV